LNTSEFETIHSGSRKKNNRGAYVMAQGNLGSLAGRSVEGWVRVGTADTRFSDIGLHVGGGLTVGPDERRFGLAVAHARLGSPARGYLGSPDDAETIVEATYAHAVGDRLIMQPAVMYVVSPGFERSLKNSLVVGVPLQLRIF
jgi:porin